MISLTKLKTALDQNTPLAIILGIVIGIGLVVAISLSLYYFFVERPDNIAYDDLVYKAKQIISGPKSDDAKDLLKQAVGIAPEKTEAYVQMAAMLMKTGASSQILDMVIEKILPAKDYSITNEILGMIYANQPNDLDNIEHLADAYFYDRTPDALNFRSYLYNETRKYEDALEDSEWVLTNKGEDLLASLSKGVALCGLHRRDLALPIFKYVSEKAVWAPAIYQYIQAHEGVCTTDDTTDFDGYYMIDYGVLEKL